MFIKKDDCLDIRQVVERNTGLTVDELTQEVTEPYIKNLETAVEYVKKYIEENVNPRITIVGDYDCDGINATAIMYKAFKLCGVNVKTRLPRRFSEGYGLSEKIIDEIDSGLVITVDNGISSLKAVEKAKNKGLNVVVIDHHMPVIENDKVVLPNADIIVDPHTENESEFKDYCGAGLAYRFARKMLPEKKLKDLLILASIATVSDVMPIVGANRTLVIDGLKYINKGLAVPGLKSLVETMGLGMHINEGDYGFKLGPAFNAPGRLYDNGAEKALSLLLCDRNDPKIKFRAKSIRDINEKRKATVKSTMDIIDATVDFDKLDDFSFDCNTSESRKPIVYYNNSIGEGIIGIVAGRLCESEQCPAIVFTDSNNSGYLKGSGRSTDDVHLKKCLDKIKDTMIGYGGHAGAAGLTIKKEDLDKFTQAFTEAVGPLPPKSDDVYYDLELNEEENFEKVIEELKKYSPYGEGNRAPIFKITCSINTKTFTLLGKDEGEDKKHFSVETKNGKLSLLGFDLVPKYNELGKPEKITVVGSLVESWFNEKRKIKFEILDFDKA